MPYAPKILAFAGSLREGSYNKKVLAIAAATARGAGAHVTLIDLRDFPMPLYDADLQASEGVPAKAREFKRLMTDHDGLLIASPEYNSSITGVLKNTIDWASRQEPGEEPLACFVGKVAGVVSASPGPFGGVRSLLQVRSILAHIRVLVVPEYACIMHAAEAFNADGSLKDPKYKAAVDKVAAALVATLAKLKG